MEVIRSIVKAAELGSLPCDLLLLLRIKHRERNLLAGKHLVELADVERTLGKLGCKFGRVSFLEHFLYVEVGEEWMTDYFLEATLRANSIRGVLVEQAVDEVLALIGHCYTVLVGIREEDGLRLDQFVHLDVV